MRGDITRRGKASWRIKFDLGADSNGKRQTRFITVKGKRSDAERELTRILGEADKGTMIDPTKLTVGEYLATWLNSIQDRSPVTVERYTDIIERQAIPALGDIELQKLRPIHVQQWIDAMRGGDRRQLSPRTVSSAARAPVRSVGRRPPRARRP